MSGIDIDTNAPRITGQLAPQPNASLWNNTPVVVTFQCSDQGDPQSGIDIDTVAGETLSAEGASQLVTSTGECTDRAGHAAAPGVVGGIQIDRTAPLVSVTGVVNGGTYLLGSVPAAGCSTTDALSGVATPASLTLTGSGGDAGSFTAHCAGASDLAGNANSATAAFTVTYDFGNGFLAPVDNPPTVNTGKAGRTYPVKWQLKDGHGSVISDLNAVSSLLYKPVGCGAWSSDPTDALETQASGGSVLRFTGGQFIYNWQTPSTRGCYSLLVLLADGTVRSANFNLT